MNACVPQLCHQANVAFHKPRLRLGGHPPQSQLERHRTRVHAGALRHPCVLGMLNHAESHACRRCQRLAHDVVFQNRMPVVRHRYRARGLQRSVVVDGLALRASCGSSNGKHTNRRIALRRQHPARRLRRVVHRNRVRHRGHRRKTPRRCRRRSGGDCLLVALPRFAQVDVHIDQPWRHR